MHHISGVYKNHFRNWLQLASLNDVNYLARYGFITDDIENKKINLHPLIQEIIYEELNPCISNCQTLVNSLHTICLMEQEHIDSVCDRALLLDYKAELAYMRKDYDVAVKKREKAIHLLENEDDTMNTMNQKRYINLLSNLYNNLSNVYLAHLKKLIKRPKPYTRHLR